MQQQQVGSRTPKFHQIFLIRDFKVQIKFRQSASQRTSAHPSAPKSRDSLRLRQRFLPLSPQNHAILRPQSGKEKTHKHKQICGIVPGLGGCQNFVYVFFFGSFLMRETKHIIKSPPKKNPGQSRENFVYVFSSLCVFSLPNPNMRDFFVINKSQANDDFLCDDNGQTDSQNYLRYLTLH